jgi:O-antigen ligase
MQSLSPFVALWIVRQKSWGLRVAGLAVLALFAIAHVLSFTRGALLTTAAVAVLSAWVIDRKRLIAYGPIAAIVLVVAMLSWSPLRGRMLTFLSLESKESRETVNTGGWRLRTIPVALTLISERPFLGLGLGQQRWNWPESTFGDLIPDPRVVDPLPIHNDYLLIPAELGVGGGIVLVLLIAIAVRNLLQIASYFRDRGDLVLSDTATATWLAILGIAMAMTMYPIVDNFRYFWLLLAVTAALMRIYSDTPTSVQSVTEPKLA